MATEPLIIERLFNAPVTKIWEAITDNKKMKEWYFDIQSFKPEVGFPFEFSGGKDDRIYLHECRVTAVIVNRLLSFTWKYKGYPGESLVTFELFPEGDKTRLKLTHSGLESFPADNPDFEKNNFLEGWTYIIGTSLNNYLNPVTA